jgi:WD40 repeat protein
MARAAQRGRVIEHGVIRIAAVLTFVVANIGGLSGVASGAPGTLHWTKVYNGPNQADKATAAVLSPSGNKLFVTGSSKGSNTGVDYATVAYKVSNGTKLWAKRFDAAGGKDKAASIAVSPNGAKVFVTGLADRGTPTEYDYATVAYKASSGTKLWVRYYESLFHDMGDGDFGRSVTVSPDSKRVFVTGASGGAGSGSHLYGTVAYKASNGHELWRRYKDMAGFASALDVSPNGKRVFVTGSYDKMVGNQTHQNYGTVAYKASSGATIWKRDYNGPVDGFDYATAIVATAKGVYVTGSSDGPASNGGSDYVTIGYKSASGAVLWKDRYDGPGNGYELANAIAAGGNKIVVTGASGGAGTGGSDYATVAYKALGSGVPHWSRTFDGPAGGKDSAASVAISPDGTQVFVTGASKAVAMGKDYGTVAYAMAPSSTTPLWSNGYGGSGSDAASVVVTNGNRILVTGKRKSSGTGLNYATLSYEV